MVDLSSLNPKRVFVDWYVRRAQRRANARADEIRDIQAETGRTERKVLKFVIYEEDMRTGRVQQMHWTYVMRVRDGYVEFMPPETSPDNTVTTDFPTLYGISVGEFTQILPSGKERVIHNFDPFDALRIGRLETDGDSSVLTNLFLFKTKIAPSLLEELRVKRPAPAA
jgi:hypothetical protein